MAETPDMIRQQIEVTRQSLAEKLQALEGQVKEAVGTVTETIETVKSGVSNTVESLSDTVGTVKETFDLSRQIERHPWGALGYSLGAGVAAGYLLAGSRRGASSSSQGIAGMNQIVPGYQPDRPAQAPRQESPNGPAHPGLATKFLSSVEGELDKIKQVAMGALLGIARDALKEALPPSLGDSVTEIMDDLTRRMGAEPIRQPVLGSQQRRAGSQGRSDNGARQPAAS